MGFVFGLLLTNKIITETCPPPPSPPVRVRDWVRIRVSFRVWGNLPKEQLT